MAITLKKISKEEYPFLYKERDILDICLNKQIIRKIQITGRFSDFEDEDIIKNNGPYYQIKQIDGHGTLSPSTFCIKQRDLTDSLKNAKNIIRKKLSRLTSAQARAEAQAQAPSK